MSTPDYECEDCIGMIEHGCYCKAMGAIAPGGPAGPEDVPQEWIVCEACCGEGEVGTGRMSHSVNSATIDPPWEIMERCPECNGVGGSLYEREADAVLSSQHHGERTEEK